MFMKRFSGLFGIQQGSRVLFSDFGNDGVMWTGFGPREVRLQQEFSDAFLEPPHVMVGLSMWDIDRRANSRVDITAENVSTTDFELVFRTWGDSRIARVRADWTAIGSVPDDENWDVG